MRQRTDQESWYCSMVQWVHVKIVHDDVQFTRDDTKKWWSRDTDDDKTRRKKKRRTRGDGNKRRDDRPPPESITRDRLTEWLERRKWNLVLLETELRWKGIREGRRNSYFLMMCCRSIYWFWRRGFYSFSSTFSLRWPLLQQETLRIEWMLLLLIQHRDREIVGGGGLFFPNTRV